MRLLRYSINIYYTLNFTQTRHQQLSALRVFGDSQSLFHERNLVCSTGAALTPEYMLHSHIREQRIFVWAFVLPCHRWQSRLSPGFSRSTHQRKRIRFAWIDVRRNCCQGLLNVIVSNRQWCTLHIDEPIHKQRFIDKKHSAHTQTCCCYGRSSFYGAPFKPRIPQMLIIEKIAAKVKIINLTFILFRHADHFC